VTTLHPNPGTEVRILVHPGYDKFSTPSADDVAVIDFAVDSGICGGDSGGPVFVSQDGQLYLSALNSAVDNNLGGTCGNRRYANAITGDRYDWAEVAAARLRVLMAK
jgi:hypothetical protein